MARRVSIDREKFFKELDKFKEGDREAKQTLHRMLSPYFYTVSNSLHLDDNSNLYNKIKVEFYSILDSIISGITIDDYNNLSAVIRTRIVKEFKRILRGGS